MAVVSFIPSCFGGGSYYVKKLPLKVMGISHIKMFHRILFAVSPEIVPVPESHRNVFTLALSRSWRSITFRRSFSCQGTREKNIPLIGRHLESLKKRLFLKVFSEILNFVALNKTYFGFRSIFAPDLCIARVFKFWGKFSHHCIARKFKY